MTRFLRPKFAGCFCWWAIGNVVHWMPPNCWATWMMKISDLATSGIGFSKDVFQEIFGFGWGFSEGNFFGFWSLSVCRSVLGFWCYFLSWTLFEYTYLAILCDLFGMAKWPPTGESKGHFEEAGTWMIFVVTLKIVILEEEVHLITPVKLNSKSPWKDSKTTISEKS